MSERGPLEIEWKFRVTHLPALPGIEPVRIRQAYFDGPPSPAIRVRLKGEAGYITIKAADLEATVEGGPLTCEEFEYAIPAHDARRLLEIAPFPIEKDRYVLPSGLELDVFHGAHAGLILAELEVSEAGEPPASPEGWAWTDVSTDPRYTNRCLAEHGVPA